MNGITIAALLIAATAHGQAVKQVGAAQAAIREQDKFLAQITGNLMGMAAGYGR